eukprot:4828811-Prorocentrum_lima.AAC.1
MTSSLVGSEMCIRDSSSNEQTRNVKSLTTKKGKQRLPQPLMTATTTETVSYTQLTLPTICSV